MYSLDAIDARILLARDSSQDASLIEIGNRLGVSRNTVHARLKRLRDADALGPPSAALSPAALGRPLLAFVTLSVSQQSIDSVYAAIAAIPEVVEAHTTTGDADLMLRVVASDTVDLHRITQSIQLAPGVQRSSTSVATTEVIPHRMSLLLQRLAVEH
ncbi:AsnC family transcriptional regulator [Arthrobacter crystallopoietes BAB-32]|uniref:AsnC family transcriptional regulator n=1 Tax=Arthrobacter crystallopoietes BAB-32 TaxID=1246476 RepID=N1V0E2_9MICC|nr:Lrp/AsnC family transcriptional regulator [Arthrobacter crystallopoietes]EMY33504.1 AsnC family transcriptional regulator [Arthrobacter crystallopoietes BAB-32]